LLVVAVSIKEDEMTDDVEERKRQAILDRRNASTLADHNRPGPGGRFSVEADKSPTTIKGGHGKGAGPWSGSDPNITEEPFGVDINAVPPME
jgi:hypothetical protein